MFSCKKLVIRSKCSGTTTLSTTGTLSRICTTKDYLQSVNIYIVVFVRASSVSKTRYHIHIPAAGSMNARQCEVPNTTKASNYTDLVMGRV